MAVQRWMLVLCLAIPIDCMHGLYVENRVENTLAAQCRDLEHCSPSLCEKDHTNNTDLNTSTSSRTNSSMDGTSLMESTLQQGDAVNHTKPLLAMRKLIPCNLEVDERNKLVATVTVNKEYTIHIFKTTRRTIHKALAHKRTVASMIFIDKEKRLIFYVNTHVTVASMTYAGQDMKTYKDISIAHTLFMEFEGTVTSCYSCRKTSLVKYVLDMSSGKTSQKHIILNDKRHVCQIEGLLFRFQRTMLYTNSKRGAILDDGKTTRRLWRKLKIHEFIPVD